MCDEITVCEGFEEFDEVELLLAGEMKDSDLIGVHSLSDFRMVSFRAIQGGSLASTQQAIRY